MLFLWTRADAVDNFLFDRRSICIKWWEILNCTYLIWTVELHKALMSRACLAGCDVFRWECFLFECWLQILVDSYVWLCLELIHVTLLLLSCSQSFEEFPLLRLQWCVPGLRLVVVTHCLLSYVRPLRIAYCCLIRQACLLPNILTMCLECCGDREDWRLIVASTCSSEATTSLCCWHSLETALVKPDRCVAFNLH